MNRVCPLGKMNKQGVAWNCIMKSSVASNRGLDRNNWRNPAIHSGIGSTGRSSMRHYFVAMRGMFVMKKVTRIETNVNGRTSLWLWLLWTKDVIVRMERDPVLLVCKFENNRGLRVSVDHRPDRNPETIRWPL